MYGVRKKAYAWAYATFGKGGGGGVSKFYKGNLSSRKIMDYMIRPIERAGGEGLGGLGERCKLPQRGLGQSPRGE